MLLPHKSKKSAPGQEALWGGGYKKGNYLTGVV